MHRTQQKFLMNHRTAPFALLLAGLTLVVAADFASAGKPLPVPERGFVSSQPAETWEQGLISGNGTIGANVLSRPLDETIVFTHERMFLPMGEPVVPPDAAARLPEVPTFCLVPTPAAQLLWVPTLQVR